MTPELHSTLLAGLADGSIVPYLGPGVLADVINPASGQPMPADSDSLILAMNDGRPMSPKLMYEFSRAAMNIELKRGRGAVNRFLTRTYGETAWSRSAVHEWLKAIRPPYVIDINRDTQLQESYADTPHTLIVGVARLGGSAFRYRLYAWDGTSYAPTESIDPAGPMLFKPMGTPRPAANFIASDADYVDFITELMGGFAIPPTIKQWRQGKRYLLLGMRLNRDTERMVLSDLIFAGAETPSGWALIPEPTPKERRFCARLGITLIECQIDALLTTPAPVDARRPVGAQQLSWLA